MPNNICSLKQHAGIAQAHTTSCGSVLAACTFKYSMDPSKVKDCVVANSIQNFDACCKDATAETCKMKHDGFCTFRSLDDAKEYDQYRSVYKTLAGAELKKSGKDDVPAKMPPADGPRRKSPKRSPKGSRSPKRSPKSHALGFKQ